MPDIKAPAMTLVAIGSGLRVTLNRLAKPAVLLFLARETANDGPPVNARLREVYPLASEVIMASVVDLHIVPRLVRGVAEAAMRLSYDKAVERFPLEFKPPEPGTPVDPQEYILILPDWDAAVTRAFGMRNPARTPGVAVLDRHGVVVGSQQGGDLAESALGYLEKILPPGADKL
jgi:hypothetical protein